MLIQPVAWHMKKVEEDVLVDENQLLLQEKKEDAIVTNTSQSNGDAQNGNINSNWDTKTTRRYEVQNGEKAYKPDATRINGKNAIFISDNKVKLLVSL